MDAKPNKGAKPPVEKNELLGKKQKHILPIIRRKDGGHMSSYKKNQTNLDDFRHDIAFLGNFVQKKTQKNHLFENDSPLINDDSLVDFYIRKY